METSIVQEGTPFVSVLGPEGETKLNRLGIPPYPLCESSHLIWTQPATMEQFVASGIVRKFKALSPPRSPFRREYEYLGDFKVNLPVCMDLRLVHHDSHCAYQIFGDLPDGLSFVSGVLIGASREATPILNLTVAASQFGKVQTKNYMVRFYDSINTSSTFTEDNFLQVGCGEELVDYLPANIYHRRIVKPLPAPVAPLLAARLAAERVFAEAKGQPIVLFASGGIDSQCMIQAFQSAGVPFHCAFLRDTGHSNKLDEDYFIRYAQKTRVPFEILDLNYRNFIESYRYLPMAHRYRFNNPEYGILLHLMDLFPHHYPVYAGRPVSSTPVSAELDVIGFCGDENLSKARYLERNRRNGCVEFIASTPLLVSSFLTVEKIKSKTPGKSWKYADKIDLLREAGFDVAMAPPIKGTGFEDLLDQFPHTEFGNTLWTDHRGYLKTVYPNPSRRTGIPLKNGVLDESGNFVIRPFDDGFSWKIATTNSVADYH